MQPLVKEHRDYAGIIDKVNDLGNAYDALTQGGRPDSPARRRSGAYSPTKRLSSTASPSKCTQQSSAMTWYTVFAARREKIKILNQRMIASYLRPSHCCPPKSYITLQKKSRRWLARGFARIIELPHPFHRR